MFNIGPGEIIIVALVLLMAVGPEQLPGVIRRAGKAVSQVRSMTEGLRADFMSGMDEIERATDPSSWAGSAGPSGEEKPPKKHSAVMTATEASAVADSEDDTAADADSGDTADAADTTDAAEGTAPAAEDTADTDSDEAGVAAEVGSDSGGTVAEDSGSADNAADLAAAVDSAPDDRVAEDEPSSNGAATVASNGSGNGTAPSDGSDEGGEPAEDVAAKTGEEEQA